MFEQHRHRARTRTRAGGHRQAPWVESLESRLLLARFEVGLPAPGSDLGSDLPVVAAAVGPSTPVRPGLPEGVPPAIDSRLQVLPPLRPDDLPALMGVPIQRLPDQNRSLTYATLAAGSKIDVWALPVHRDAPEVRVDLQLSELADPRTEAVVLLLDQARNVLGQLPLNGPGARLSLMLHPQDPASGIFLGIMRQDALNPSGMVEVSPPIAYTISVDRGVVSSLTPVQDAGYTARADGPLNAVDRGAWQVAPRLDANEGSWASAGPYAASDPPLGIGQDGVGDLPLRSAGPSGGVLADRPSAPEVGRLEGVVVDLTLMELSPDLDGSALDDSPSRLTAIASADGFPLLSVGRPSAHFRDRAEPAPAEAIEPPVVHVAAASAERERSARRRVTSPTLAFSLSLGAAATLVLLLPDFTLKFAPVSPRRRLPWEQSRSRRRWRNLFGPDADDSRQSG